MSESRDIKISRDTMPVSGRSQFALILAVLVSVAAHGLAGYIVYDRQVAVVESGLPGEDEVVMRVRRSPLDDTYKAAAVREIASEEGLPESQLASLGQGLLSGEAGEVIDRGEEVSPVEMRSVVEGRALLAVEDAAGDEASRGYSDKVSEKIAGSVVLELPRRVTREAKVVDGGGDVSGRGKQESTSEAAGRMLADAGLVVDSRRADGPIRIKSYERASLVEKRGTETAVEIPSIDFASAAIDATTKLKIPEHLDNDFSYTLTTWHPAGEAGYFQVDIQGHRTLRRLKTMRKDVVFLIDTSGSVSSRWVKSVVSGVTDSLNTLSAADRFNIVFFNESPSMFADGVQAANSVNIDKAREYLANASSGGFTDVNRALSRLLVRDMDFERVYNLVLISDGKPTKGVMDTRELINMITRDNDLSAGIYCVGVGDDQNREMLEFLAYRNRGYCLFTEKSKEAGGVVRDLMSRLRYPIITDVSLSAVGLEGAEIYPVVQPNIHQGEKFSIFGKYGKTGRFTVRLLGRNGNDAVDVTFSKDLNEAVNDDAGIPRKWAFAKLHYVYSEMIGKGETAELKEEVKELRKRYRLKTVY